ncbi:MAG: hypothetical protein IJT44_01515, partial [Clostridia bacterium]|nr:hypothetical protein [Clostridia bacterium]
AWTKLDDAQHTRTCSVGGETETEAHTFDEDTTPASCTAAGKTVYTCSFCGYSYEETIPQLEHNWSAWTKIDETNHGRTCSVGGETETEAHAFSEETTPASCTAAGKTVYTCSVCGYSYEEAIAQLEHNWSTWTKVDETNHSRTCSVGGETETAAHTFGDWTVTTEPTTDKEGEEAHACTLCGYTETRSIPKLAPSVLTLTDNPAKEGKNVLAITVPYSRRGRVAATLIASEEGVKYTIDAKGSKVLKIGDDGKLTFVRLCPCHKTAVITATSADGQRTATCQVTIKYKWWHYLIWLIFGCLWF